MPITSIDPNTALLVIDWAPVTEALHATMALAAGSEDPIFEVIARGHAATNGFWVSIAVPTTCAPAGPSSRVGPTGISSSRLMPTIPR